jgi:hypothetical protein
VVAVLDEAAEAAGPADVAVGPWKFPVLEDARWPADMPLTREEMYDDDGR